MQGFDKKEYKKLADSSAKKSSTVKNCIMAFIGGGLICLLGQILFIIYTMWMSEDQAKLLVSVTLIFLAGLLTGLGWFDVLAKYFGAGTLVPITGFANAVAAAAIDNKSEGYVTGVGAKMFIIAGSVVVYGVSFSVIYGIAYYIWLAFA